MVMCGVGWQMRWNEVFPAVTHSQIVNHKHGRGWAIVFFEHTLDLFHKKKLCNKIFDSNFMGSRTFFSKCHLMQSVTYKSSLKGTLAEWKKFSMSDFDFVPTAKARGSGELMSSD